MLYWKRELNFLPIQVHHLDVVELKTYAQFMLLGDPSIHPVQAVINTVSSSNGPAWINTRKNRRENLKAKGSSLQQSMIPPTSSEKIELPLEIQPEVKKLLKENKMKGEIVKEVFINKSAQAKGNEKSATGSSLYCLRRKRSAAAIRFPANSMIKEKGNQLLGSRIYLSH